MKTKKGVLSSFLAAYKQSANVARAEKQSGYALHTEYPPAGFYVYALIDPRDEKIFYVGKGIGGRVLKHEERTRRGVLQNREKVKCIQEIFAAGGKYSGAFSLFPKARRSRCLWKIPSSTSLRTSA